MVPFISLISQIRVTRNKQRAVLLVDSRYSKQMTSPKKARGFTSVRFSHTDWYIDALHNNSLGFFSTQADLLDVVGMLYVGGLPQNYTTKRIGPVKDTQSYLSYRTPLTAVLSCISEWCVVILWCRFSTVSTDASEISGWWEVPSALNHLLQVSHLCHLSVHIISWITVGLLCITKSISLSN